MKYEISKSLIKLDELEYIIREINYGELSKTWVNSIENAWIKGAFLDKRGIVWIKYQYLPKLARIKKELVNYYLALIGLPISDYISGTTISGAISSAPTAFLFQIIYQELILSILYPLFLMLLQHLEKGIILDILRSCIILLEIQIKLKY